jgi:recombination protein U
MKHGAMCFLVVSIGFEKFYRVPWVVFRDMKKIYGHKYMNEVELEPYQVTYKNGILRFLDGVELKGKENDDEG